MTKKNKTKAKKVEATVSARDAANYHNLNSRRNEYLKRAFKKEDKKSLDDWLKIFKERKLV